jgi:hypothetical protein
MDIQSLVVGSDSDERRMPQQPRFSSPPLSPRHCPVTAGPKKPGTSARMLSSFKIVAAAVACTCTLAAQGGPAVLEWGWQLPGLPIAEAGAIYNVFDDRTTLRLSIGFTNDSDRSLSLPPDFLARIRMTLVQGSASSPASVEWVQATHASALVSDRVPVGLAITLGPGDSFGATGLIRSAAERANIRFART